MTDRAQGQVRQRRNRAYDQTHTELLEGAARLIAQKGVDALSIAALAREVGINRTTVYYHFARREHLVEEVKAWASTRLAEAFEPDRSVQVRMDHIYHFVLENPELLRMWINDGLGEGAAIRSLYPNWDELVQGLQRQFRAVDPAGEIDVEVFSLNLLLTAFIGPLLFRQAVHPEADIDAVAERFKAESSRALRALGLLG
jgi:AcrR family transcriptional regulator